MLSCQCHYVAEITSKAALVGTLCTGEGTQHHASLISLSTDFIIINTVPANNVKLQQSVFSYHVVVLKIKLSALSF